MKPMRFTPLLLLLSLLAGSVPARAAAESTDAKAPAAVPDEPVAAYRVALLELRRIRWCRTSRTARGRSSGG